MCRSVIFKYIIYRVKGNSVFPSNRAVVALYYPCRALLISTWPNLTNIKHQNTYNSKELFKVQIYYEGNCWRYRLTDKIKQRVAAFLKKHTYTYIDSLALFYLIQLHNYWIRRNDHHTKNLLILITWVREGRVTKGRS